MMFSSSGKSDDESDIYPEIRIASDIHLTSEVKTILQTMFKGFSQVAVEAEFGGGFSGSRVFRIRLIETNGRAHLPAVIKIAPIGLIEKEWQAYRTWVEHRLPNTAHLEMPPNLPSRGMWGGLRYSLVGGGGFRVQSLRAYYWEANINDLGWVLENRLFEVMRQSWWLDGRVDRAFQMQTDYDVLLPVNLLITLIDSPSKDNLYTIDANDSLPSVKIVAGDQIQLKGFVVTRIDIWKQQLILNRPSALKDWPTDSYQVRLQGISNLSLYQVGEVIDTIFGEVAATRHDLLLNQALEALGKSIDLSAEQLPISPNPALSTPLSLPNPLLTYQKLLLEFVPVYVSIIHGDLNMENILIDPATREIYLIDFATVHQGHNLRDLLRLEVETVIHLIPPVLAKAGLPPETIYSFYEQLHRVTLAADWMAIPQLPSPDLEKPFETLKVIRKMARKCLFDLDDWREYYQGLVLCLLGTLKFENLKRLPTAPLPQRVAFWAAATAQHLLDMIQSHQEQPLEADQLPPWPRSGDVGDTGKDRGTMHPDSKFYIERAVDKHCWAQIAAPYATTLFIQAPRQMGKSSLMRRMLEQAKTTLHKRSAFIDFQKFPENYFFEEKALLIELCLMIGDALRIPEAIDRYWQSRRTDIRNCSLYLSDYIIPQVNEPFILAMDEVERMFSSPFQANFFGMLRTWHNDRAYDENFARLTLFLSSSTEPYLFIDNPNQSPFNVAEVFSLQDFSREEVEELNRRHHSLLTGSQLSDLMDLINGHPFLTRLALYLLTTGKVADFQVLLAHASEDTGPFGDHLRHFLLRVLQQPELKQALTHICRHYTHEEDQIFYRLKGAGLIKKEGQQIVFRNKLYDRYFKERLNV